MTTVEDFGPRPAPSAEKLEQAVAAVESLSDQIDRKSGAPTPEDVDRLRAATDGVKQLKEVVRREQTSAAHAFLATLGGETFAGSSAGIGSKEAWAKEAADRLTKSVGDYGIKALTTGGIDVPQPVESVPVRMPVAPTRVLDLLINRRALTGNTFEYLRQTVRDNLAAPSPTGSRHSRRAGSTSRSPSSRSPSGCPSRRPACSTC